MLRLLNNRRQLNLEFNEPKKVSRISKQILRIREVGEDTNSYGICFLCTGTGSKFEQFFVACGAPGQSYETTKKYIVMEKSAMYSTYFKGEANYQFKFALPSSSFWGLHKKHSALHRSEVGTYIIEKWSELNCQFKFVDYPAFNGFREYTLGSIFSTAILLFPCGIQARCLA